MSCPADQSNITEIGKVVTDHGAPGVTARQLVKVDQHAFFARSDRPAYRVYSLVDLPARISRTGQLLQAAGTARLVVPNELIRQLVRYGVILLLAFAAPPQVSASTIYSYIDGRGVTHFTNVPADRRYQVYELTKRVYKAPKRHTGRRYQKTSHHRSRVSPFAFDHHIQRAAFEQEVDPLLIKAIIKTESDFNQYAVSARGAQGLMQLMPETAQDMQVKNPFDAAQNINGGTRYFKLLLDNYKGDLTRSLAAYNAGPSRVSKAGPIPKFPETRAYVRKVIQRYRRYQQKTGSSRVGNIKVRKMVTVN